MAIVAGFAATGRGGRWETLEAMSLKPFYLIGAATAAIAAAAAVTVFAADTPAVQPTPKPTTAAPAKAAPAKGERKIVRMEPSFAEVDSNHDGSISPAEFDAFHKAHMPPMPEDGMRPGMMAENRGWGPPMMMLRMNRRGPEEGMGRMGMHGERALDLLDTNNDGKLSFDEMIAPLKRHFDRMDANHDGTLSSDELAHGHGKFEGKFERPAPPPEG